MINTDIPQLKESETNSLRVSGCWQVHALAEGSVMQDIERELKQYRGRVELQWNLTDISALDHIGAQLLWNCWDKKRPAHLTVPPKQDAFFKRLELANKLAIPGPTKARLTSIMKLGNVVLGFFGHMFALTALLGQLVLDLIHVIRHPIRAPWKEISANVYKMGFCAQGADFCASAE